MLFACSTDDHSLITFSSESDAIAYAEGVDVENGIWRFFGNDGFPLEAIFIKPNHKGQFSVTSGQYRLQPCEKAGHLKDVLPEVATFEGKLLSREAVEQELAGQVCK